jgi:AAA+ superfamily predicted ATPase
MGKIVIDNDFSYKFIECGSYIYDIPRTSISVKLERKHSVITVYINDIIVDEIITNDDKSYISNIINYGNM